MNAETRTGHSPRTGRDASLDNKRQHPPEDKLGIPLAGGSKPTRADGSGEMKGCFWCQGHTDYHPTCDRPGCDNDVHGFGPDGKRTISYCGACRTTHRRESA